MTPRYKTGDVLLVTWVDAEEDEGWAVAKELDKTGHPVTSVGIWVREAQKPGHIVLVGEYAQDSKEVNRIMSIPRGTVTKVELLHKGVKDEKTIRKAVVLPAAEREGKAIRHRGGKVVETEQPAGGTAQEGTRHVADPSAGEESEA